MVWRPHPLAKEDGSPDVGEDGVGEEEIRDLGNQDVEDEYIPHPLHVGSSRLLVMGNNARGPSTSRPNPVAILGLKEGSSFSSKPTKPEEVSMVDSKEVLVVITSPLCCPVHSSGQNPPLILDVCSSEELVAVKSSSETLESPSSDAKGSEKGFSSNAEDICATFEGGNDNPAVRTLEFLEDVVDHSMGLQAKQIGLGDLKPAPVLWHEDTGRKPWENGRQNPPGTISGRQLGEAAHRLVVNSLQLKTDHQIHPPPPSYAAAIHGTPPSYPNGRYQHQDYQGMVPPRTDYPAHGNRFARPPTVRNHLDHGYGQPYAPSASHHPYERSSHPQYENNNTPVTYMGDHPMHGYPPVSVQNGGGLRYPPRNVAAVTGARVRPSDGYNGYQSYQAYGATTSHQQRGGGWGPAANQRGVAGRHGHPQQLGNQYAALERGSSRRQPPPGYGRY
ncbi:hypothetical protein HHK36_031223 [Tetracentron sinense]|uniref:Uncharacterized protein n=1 Tax=Tetracentron sinense TaxID=13715 RepID=A0A834YAJ6_TETSI|nr:hypothetical protein HHK36_031223 [Tetracentron sinense]